MNREAWLTELGDKYLCPLIEAHGGTRRKYRVSVGFPKGSRGGRKSIGQCWSQRSSADGTFEVFVSPVLVAEDAAETLLHELIHVSDELKSGHKGEFARLAKAVGLEGKMTATVAGPELKKKLYAWIKSIGAFPHAPLVPSEGEQERPGSRLIKCECGSCGFVFRTTHKWLQASGGYMRCPAGDCDGEVKVS